MIVNYQYHFCCMCVCVVHVYNEQKRQKKIHIWPSHSIISHESMRCQSWQQKPFQYMWCQFISLLFSQCYCNGLFEIFWYSIVCCAVKLMFLFCIFHLRLIVCGCLSDHSMVKRQFELHTNCFNSDFTRNKMCLGWIQTEQIVNERIEERYGNAHLNLRYSSRLVIHCDNSSVSGHGSSSFYFA